MMEWGKIKLDNLNVSDMEARSRIINTVLIIISVLCIPALILALFRITIIGWQPIMYVHFLSISAVWTITLLSKHLPYYIRAGVPISLLAFSGLLSLWSFGFAGSAAFPLLILIPILVSIFFDTRSSYISLALIAVISSFIAMITVTQHRLPPFDLTDYLTSWPAWSLAIFVSLMTGGSVTFAFAKLKAHLTASSIVSNRQTRLLQSIVEETSTSTGEDFFRHLTRSICEGLRMDYALIGEIVTGDALRIKTIAVRANGKASDNIEYYLDGTPCQNVTEFGACCYPENVQNLFPEDILLRDMGVESYAGVPLQSSEGKPLGLLVALDSKPMQDIDLINSILTIFSTRASAELERLQMQDRAKQQEQRLKFAIEAIDNGFALYDRDDRLVLRNFNYCKSFGEPGEAVVPGMAFTDVLRIGLKNEIYPEAIGREEEWLAERVLKYRNCVESFEQPLSGGRWERLSQYKTLNGERVCIFSDITDQKLSEQTLRASEEKYRGIFDESVAAIYVCDNEKNILDCNQAGLDLLGYSREELIGMNMFDLVHDPEAEKMTHLQLLDGGRIINFEHQLIRKDGKIITVLNNSRPLTDSNGHVIGNQSTLLDITKRKTAEKELQKNNHILKEAQRIGHLGNWNWDIKTNAVTWSDEVYRIFGVDQETFRTNYDNFLSRIHPEERDKVHEAVTLALENTPYNSRHRIVLPSGEIRYVHDRGEVFQDATGRPVRMAGTVQDITEQKLAEIELQNSKEHFQGLVKALPDIVFLIDEDGNYQETYVANEELIVEGWDYENDHRNIADFFPDDTTSEIFTLLREALETGDLKRYRYQLQVRAGLLWFEGRMMRTKVRRNGKRCVISVSRDITREHEAEQALRQSEQEFRTILNNTTDLITVLSGTSKIIFTSKSSEEMLGYQPEELMSRNYLEFLHPDDRKIIREKITELNSKPGEEARGEYRFKHKDGSWRTLSSIGKNTPEETQYQGIVVSTRDVTERRLMEQAIQRSEELLHAAIETTDEGFIVFDEDERFVMCNSKYREIYAELVDLLVPGVKLEDILRESARRNLFPEATGRIEEWVAERIQQHRCKNYSTEQRLANGKWLKSSMSQMPNGAAVGVRVDITELKQAEENARLAQERFRDFAESASDWFWETGPDMRFTYISSEASGFHIKARRFLGKNRLELMQDLQNEDFINRHKDDLDNHRPFTDLEYWILDEQDLRWCVQTSGKPLFDEQDNFIGYRGVARDITEHKLTEMRQAQTQKMEALGRLAGGIAHDFNNTLQPITLLSSAIKKSMNPENPVYQNISIINDAVTQLSSLTRQIIQFSRQGDTDKSMIDICNTVREAVVLSSIALPENVVIDQRLDETAGVILANAAELQSVMMNLITNAVDAYDGEPGEIRISLDKRLDGNHPGNKGFIKLTIADDGTGISDEILPYIFEPFYSTKTTGKGIGLGLSSVYGIVTANHGGRIEVKSKPGQGAIFEIILPILNDNHIEQNALQYS